MAKKGGSFWDNPFGGLFDFNRDGREDFSEQWLALKIFEECTKHNSDTDDGYYYSSGRIGRTNIAQNRYEWRLYCEDGCDVGVVPEDFETAEEYEEALAEARSQWRNDCEDGSDVNIDPEDFDTEEEYTEALEAARASKQRQITINLQVEIPGMEALSAINPKDYPNRRMYEAAYRLCDVRQGTAYISEDSSADAEIEKCQFILNSDTVAAKYLTVYKGFLYAQAVKEHFDLPINIPDEDESVITYFDDFIREVAEEDAKLAVEIWGWCIKQFGPYTQYMYDHRALYNFTMCSVDEYPDEFLNVAAQVIGNDPEFCDGLLTKSKDFPCCCSPIIIRALKNGLEKEASLMFIAAILNPAGRGKDIEELIDRIISGCSDWEEVETMESFQKHILPVIEKIAHKRIKRLYPKFADKVTSYIHSVERSSNRYQYSRCHAWRRNCVDGSEYDIDPLDYETEAEYNQAIYDEKYAWRQWAAIDARKYGIDPTAFETEEAFSTAVDNARREELQKRCGKQTQQQSRNVWYADPLAQTDKAVYTFCGVLFENSSTIYFYRTSDESITVGDYVAVPVGRDEKEIIAEVVTVQKHRRATAPYPVDKAKYILRRLEPRYSDSDTDIDIVL